eukprot:530429-Amphidinium_carterae.1
MQSKTPKVELLWEVLEWEGMCWRMMAIWSAADLKHHWRSTIPEILERVFHLDEALSISRLFRCMFTSGARTGRRFCRIKWLYILRLHVFVVSMLLSNESCY